MQAFTLFHVRSGQVTCRKNTIKHENIWSHNTTFARAYFCPQLCRRNNDLKAVDSRSRDVIPDSSQLCDREWASKITTNRAVDSPTCSLLDLKSAVSQTDTDGTLTAHKAQRASTWVHENVRRAAPARTGYGKTARLGAGGRLWTSLHVKLQQSLTSSNLLGAAESVLVAVSGGQDSVCLLHALVDLRPIWGWRLGVVHCDHGWRVDSAVNADFVRELAAQHLDLPCYVRAAPQGAVPSERAAREWRYRVFADVAFAHGYDVVVTGHTATDRAETMLLNLLRGSGPDGLVALARSRPLGSYSPADPTCAPGGELSDIASLNGSTLNPHHDGKHSDIPRARSRSVRLVRPLLEFSRSQTQEFVEQLALPYFHDTTNDCNDLRRNRLRNEVLPALRAGFNPRLDQALFRFLEVLDADLEYLTRVTEDLYDNVVSYEYRASSGDHSSVPAQGSSDESGRICGGGGSGTATQQGISDSGSGGMLKLHELRRLPLAMQRRVVRKWLESAMDARARRGHRGCSEDGSQGGGEGRAGARAGNAPSRVRYEDVARCLALLHAPNRSNSDSLCGGMVASVRDGHLVLWTPKAAAVEPGWSSSQQQRRQRRAGAAADPELACCTAEVSTAGQGA